jgi:predicted RNase H-like HicB family nuclease
MLGLGIGPSAVPAASGSGVYFLQKRMKLEDYKTVLYRQQDGSWVAEIPAIAGCYALMDTREAALAELSKVFGLIAEEYREKGLALPSDTTEIVNA